jgi:hypothetical protein
MVTTSLKLMTPFCEWWPTTARISSLAGYPGLELTAPDWRDQDARLGRELKRAGRLEPFEKEYIRKDGNRVPVLIGAANLDESGK